MIDYWSKLKLNECWSKKQRFNIILNAILNGEELVVETPIEEVSNVTVTVIDKDTEDTVDNAVIHIYDGEYDYDGITTDGTCIVENVPYGEYTLDVEAEDYVLYSDSFSVDEESISVEISIEKTNTNDNDVGEGQ